MIFWISNKWGDKIMEFETEYEASQAFNDISDRGVSLMIDDIVLASK